MILKKFNDYLYDDRLDIHRRLYVLYVTMTTAMILILAAETFIFERKAAVFMQNIVLAGVFVLVAFIAVKTKHLKTGAVLSSIFTAFILYPIIMIKGGGVEGSGPIWFVYNVFMINMILSGGIRIIFSVLEIILTVALYLLSYFHPELFETVTGVIYYAIDVTTLLLVASNVAVVISIENRLYLQQVEKMQKQGEEIKGLVASQNRFFSSMSHEIRTPINTIIGLNEMILRENISDEIAEDAVNIRSAGKMLLNTINDILDMSKFQSGDMHLLEEEYGSDILISMMSQYTPIKGAGLPDELDRTLSAEEYAQILEMTGERSEQNIYTQQPGSAGESFIPPFDLTGVKVARRECNA